MEAFPQYIKMKHFNSIFIVFCAVICLTGSCSQRGSSSWTASERETISKADSIMRVLTVDDPDDSLFLRQPCTDLSNADLVSDEYSRLCSLMLSTVTDPSQDGVGIAGPQVGISRRIVAVLRYDRLEAMRAAYSEVTADAISKGATAISEATLEAAAWGVYPNIRITATYGERKPGSEGCLSVPKRRGTVDRYQSIDITYTDPKTLRDTTEHIEGFTAVIFQHETDHLDGILYTDYL